MSDDKQYDTHVWQKNSNIKLPVLCEITELTIAYVNKHPLDTAADNEQ